MLNIFKRNAEKKHKAETMKAVNAKLAQNQESVYQAVKDIDRPVNGLRVARALGWDSSSVTNRIAELVKKGRLKVAYNKRGLDGKWRRFYVINEGNQREFDSGD